ncbi:hypothetical protein VNO78_06355 [Psophocarpus tetragonolobus]|uniref:Uncharacterized protein n=1 Tax=Psophocarpus tetragonolobus TaxID=3891 RepID=A0AAN9XR23_PSOTE
MAKISFTATFALALIITVISGTSQVVTGNRCTKVLNPNECNLSKCQSICQPQYKGTGYCVGKFPHQCVCVYDCPP